MEESIVAECSVLEDSMQSLYRVSWLLEDTAEAGGA
jgi:hypothetical protein